MSVPELRPANEEDVEFLRDLYFESRLHETMAWGWGEKERLAFLNMQFMIQMKAYPLSVEGLQHDVILVDNERIGRLVTLQEVQCIRLADILIAGRYRGKGVGTQIIQRVQDEARAKGKKY